MTETGLLASSEAEAAAATEGLAAWVIGALTTIVIGGVALVIYGPRGGHADGSSWLSAINASLNGTTTVLLRTGYVLIRRRRIAAHRTCMIAAFAASSLFLITYLIHHAQLGSVPFHGPPWLRPVYFGRLVPQIVLAALVVPLALTTIYGAWCGRFDRHRRLARVTLPHLALRLDQRRSGVCPPLPLRSLSPTFFGTQVPAYGSCHCPSFV